MRWRNGTLALTMLTISACHEASPPPYYAADEPYIEKAYYLYSGKGKMPREQVLREVYPVVVGLPTAVCVGLYKRKAGWTGSNPTICFAKDTGNLLIYYEDDKKLEGPVPRLP